MIHDLTVQDIIVGPEANRTLNPSTVFARFMQGITSGLRALQNTTSGSTTGTPSGTGQLSITHGLGSAPTLEKTRAQIVGTSFASVNLVSVNATTLVVKLFDAAGAAITSGSWTVAWTVAV